MTPIEEQVIDMENAECNALLKRDTVKLRSLWVRDFTLDEEPPNKVVSGKNSLPYYISLSRMVEHFSELGDIINTSGYETYQRLASSGEMDEPVKRNFQHTWRKQNGRWKLSLKTMSE